MQRSRSSRTLALGSLALPLLKGAWWGEPWVAVKQTGIGAEIERYLGVSTEDVKRVFNEFVQGKAAVILSVVPNGKPELAGAQQLKKALEDGLDPSEVRVDVGVAPDESRPLHRDDRSAPRACQAVALWSEKSHLTVDCECVLDRSQTALTIAEFDLACGVLVVRS